MDALWDGSLGQPLWVGTLNTANGNSGLALLNPNTWTQTVQYLDALVALGADAAKLDIHYPLLTRAFHDYLTERNSAYTATADDFLAFFRAVAAAARERGLKVFVDHSSLFPSYTAMDASGYYASIKAAGAAEARRRYRDERAAEAALIATELAPDRFTLLDEPNTQNANFGPVAGTPLFSPSGWQDYVEYAAGAIAAAAPDSPAKLGAGAGTWEQEEYVTRFASIPGLSYLDFHVYPLRSTTTDYMQRLLDWIDLARSTAPSLDIVLGEAWLYKATASELGTISDTEVHARYPWSFWEPLDRQYLEVLYATAHAKRLAAVAPMWTVFFFKTFEYGDPSLAGLSPVEILAEAIRRSAENAAAGTLTSTGEKFRDIVNR
jgi:hypothetical protein